VQVREQTYKVVPVEITKNEWRYQPGQPDSAQWVYGTLINYVVGLESTPENADLLQALSEADTIQLTISSGKMLAFKFSGRQWVARKSAPDVFQQLRPGLTLVLLGDKGDQRLVVTAGYLAGVEPTPEPGAELAKVGAPIQIGEARVKVLNGKLVKEAANLPAGQAYYLVDFFVEGLGPNKLDASLFQMDLIDGAGKRYALYVPASQAGTYGPPGGQLEPGQVLTATVGYLVPQTISGPLVVWTFSPRPGLTTPARVQLSLAGPAPTPEPRLLTTVQLNTVTYSEEHSQIVVTGGIGNPGSAVVTINQGDISLESGGAMVPLLSAEPALPIEVKPGESRAFTLRFGRPAPGAAVLRILNWSFELSGLQ
jgi:hypothetical protein